jgi:HK97 family phage major capsid protein
MQLAEKIEELGRGFEEFKTAHKAELVEIKKFGTASAETTAKVDKINGALDKLEKQVEELGAALNRSAKGELEKETAERDGKLAQYKKDMGLYMRKGVEIGAELRDFVRKDMSVDSDENGGFLVSPEVSSEIVKKVFESTPMRELSSVQTISSDALEIMQDLDEASAGWVAERAARTATNTPTLKKIVIPAHEIYAEPLATQKILDDAAINIEAWLGEKVSSKFGRMEATAFLTGDGVNKPKGILNYGVGDGFGLIERINAADDVTLAADDLIDLQSALKEPYQAGASWLLNRLVLKLVRKMKDLEGRYIWQPGLSVGMPGTILDKPYRMAADLASSITASSEPVLYGDFKQGYQIVDRLGIRVLRDPYTTKGSVMFYTTKRVGGAVKNFEAIKVLKTLAS